MYGHSAYSLQPEDDYFSILERPETWDCNTCGREWRDPERAHVTTVGGYEVCKACVQMCPVCGEYIDDLNKPFQGPAVKYRRWEIDGVYSDPTHALCAAGDILHMLRVDPEDRSFDAELATRQEIAAIVAHGWT